MKTTIALAALIGMFGTGTAYAQSATAANALNEGNARSMMMNYGCNNVSQLSHGKNGWYGQCSKGGRTIDVMVKPDGTVGPATGAERMTEASARAALMDYGCNNLSTLSHDASGAWHGSCTKGGSTQFVTVDEQGKVKTGRANSITEGNARSALMQFGCNNVSSLSESGSGTWTGECSKGGRTVNVAVDQTGKAMVR